MAGIDMLLTLCYGMENGSAATVLQLVQRIEATQLNLVMWQKDSIFPLIGKVELLESRINVLAKRMESP